MKKEHVNLTNSDREQLELLLNKGSLKARVYKRINALLELDKGRTFVATRATVGFSVKTLRLLAKKYALVGLDCLKNAPRPGRPLVIGPEVEKQLVLLSCESPPEGHSQWSLRLLADRMVVLGHCDDISHTQVAKLLKKTSKATFGQDMVHRDS